MSIRRHITTWLTIGMAGAAGPAALRADEAMTRLAQRIHQIRQSVSAPDSGIAVAARKINGSNERETVSGSPKRPAVQHDRTATEEPRRLAEFKVPARPLASARRTENHTSAVPRTVREPKTAQRATPQDEPLRAASPHQPSLPATPPVQVTLDVRGSEPTDVPQWKTESNRPSGGPASSPRGTTSRLAIRAAAPSVPSNIKVLRQAPSRLVSSTKTVLAGDAETIRVDRSGRPVRLYLPAAIDTVRVEGEDVCRAWRSGAKEITVVGVAAGTAGVTVRLRSSSGTRRFRIVVGGAHFIDQAQEERLNDVVRAAFESSDISVYAEHGRYVVEGTVPNEEEAITVLSFVRGVCLHPVVDRLQVEKK